MGQLLRGVAAVQGGAAAAGLLLISGLVVASVVARYVLQAPLAWSEEGSKLALMLTVYLGTASVSLHGDHLRADVFGEMLSPAVRRVREVLVETLMAVMLGLVAVHTVLFAARIREVGQITAALSIPQWVLIAAFSVGIGLMVFAHLVRIMALLRGSALPTKSAPSEEARP